MKKLLSFIPAVIAVIFYLLIAFSAGFGSIQPSAWICTALLIIAGIFIFRNHWWGCLFGIAVGIFLIYSGTKYTGQIINEQPIGSILGLYYAILGFFVYRKSIT